MNIEKYPAVTPVNARLHRYRLPLLLIGCCLVGLLIWAIDPAGWRKPAMTAGLAESACWFPVPKDYEVDCYYLRVPETRAISLRPLQTGVVTQTLALPVVVVRGQAQDGAAGRADPVVYLSGGPGDGAWIDAERIPWWWDFIARNDWLATRDVVLFDQRGSGMAAGDMDCPDAQEIALQWLGLDETAAAALERRSTRACAEAVLASGHDATAYTSRDNAEDLHALFQALGLPRWNVYGLSYGTRLALEYMRQHPGDIRAVILDSVLPPQAQFYEDDAVNTARAFRQLTDGCGADADCDRAYPHLAQDLVDLVARLDRTPLVLDRLHPDGIRSVRVRIDGSRLIYRLFGLLYNRDDIAYLPRLIDAYQRNVTSEIEADLANYVWEIYGREDFGDAMFLSVQCFEEMPFNDAAKALAAYADYPLLRDMAMTGEAPTYAEICRIWSEVLGAPPARASDTEPVSSDVPTLLLAGAYDPVTPPEYARMAAQSLGRSFLVEFPGLGHDALGNDDCANQVAADFLAAPETEPAPACLRRPEPVDFYTPPETEN